MPTWHDNLLPRVAALGTDKRLPWVAAVLLTVLLAQGLATLTWELLPRPAIQAIPISNTGSLRAPAQRQQDQQQARQLAQWHLFGETPKAAPPPINRVTEAPDTRLNLKLLGVLASANPSGARAIISDGKGQEDAYAIGENLPGNAVLREIYADRVILEHRGRLETLRLPKEAEQGVNVSVGRSAEANLPKGGVGVLDTATAEPSALLRQYREALVSDPQSLMSLVQAVPELDKATGRLKGYRISPGRDRQLLGRFGLVNGDIVTAVNGVPLDNPIKGLEILRDLTTASSVNLDVERKGVMQSFTFQVD